MIDFGTDLARPLFLSFVFTVFGVIVFMGCLWLIQRVCPFSIRKEIEEDQNIALGIIMGCLVIGVAIILAASLVDFSVVVPAEPATVPAPES